MSDDDYDIEPIWDRDPDKKRKNSGRKGKRGESNLCKLLTERFGKPFARVPQSGAIGTTREMSEHVREAYVGDIVTPQHFRFCIEVKHGYAEIDLSHVIGHGGNKQLDSFLEQASRDAVKIGREPLLCWKKDRLPWLAFMKPGDFWHDALCEASPIGLRYRAWDAFDLKSVLALDDGFWFRHP